MKIRGACHCGNISFDLDWSPDPVEIPARACDCSFCVKHGGVWTSDVGARLRVRIGDRSRVSEYLFGTRTATFHICSACGVPPLVTTEIDGQTYAVVNVNTFDEAARKAPTNCPIKGHVAGSARTYVMPWASDYDRTRVVASRGGRWFCTEDEAVSAGWKAASR